MAYKSRTYNFTGTAAHTDRSDPTLLRRGKPLTRRDIVGEFDASDDELEQRKITTGLERERPGNKSKVDRLRYCQVSIFR